MFLSDFLSDKEPIIKIIGNNYYLVFKYNQGICAIIKEFHDCGKIIHYSDVYNLVKEIHFCNKLTDLGHKVNNIVYNKYNLYMTLGNIYKKAVLETVEIAKERNKIIKKKEKSLQYLQNFNGNMIVKMNLSEVFLKQISSFECLKNPSLIEFIDQITTEDEIIKKILLLAIDVKKIDKNNNLFEIIYKIIQNFYEEKYNL